MPPKKTRSKRKRKQTPLSPVKVSPLFQPDSAELPPPPSVEENFSDSFTVENGFQNKCEDEAITSLVSAFQDDVIIEADESIPNYLRYDHCLQSYVFQLSKFDYDTTIEELKMNNKELVKKMTWNQFSFANCKLLGSFCKTLFSVYKYGFSAKFMRNFCAGLTTKLPVCEKMYYRLKKKSARGKLNPDLSKTSKQCKSFSEFLFSRMNLNTRYHVQKTAKERNERLKIKKHNSSLVAARNRKRKKNNNSPSTTED